MDCYLDISLNKSLFLMLGIQIEKKFVEIIKCDSTWEIMSKLVRAVFPLLIVLRLTDQQEPFMDKLYFYVRRMDNTLVKSKYILDEVEKQSSSISCRTLLDMNSIDMLNEDSTASESEYDSETCDEEDSLTASTLGHKVMEIWNKRRNKLINDFTIAGWLLSPVPEVYEDSIANTKGEHRDAVERLLKKMYATDLADDSEELASLLNGFWDEFEHFQSKTGPFEKQYIWKGSNPDLRNGRSHFWHKKNSVPYTTILGKFACRVCSKIVGMGSAERNWGDVKHLKSDKRAHLSSDAVQKQATIFGASCMLNARLERKSKQGTLDDPYKFWNDDDFDKEFTSFSNEKQTSEKDTVRVFKCYLEDWEKLHLRKKDDVSKAKFLQKYGGLEFDDVDLPVHYVIDNTQLHFQRRTKHDEGGWCVCATSDQVIEEGKEADFDEDENMDRFTTWSISENCALFDCIASYYTLNPQKNVMVVLRKGQAEDIAGLTSCGGCGQRATPHHKCDKCKKNMHVSCGRIIGVAGDRSRVRCPKCDGQRGVTRKRVTNEKCSITICGGCGKEAGPVHKCDKCNRNMHPFCGRTIGEEGYGAPVRCPDCDEK